MKTKFIAYAFVIAFVLLVMTGCSAATLPKGTASTIQLTSGWKISDCQFEYVNENTVKITYGEKNYVIYVPVSNIDVIYVQD